MPFGPRLGRVAIVVVLVMSGAAYARDLRNPFFGSDTWPWLVSTRAESVGDVVRIVFSPIMSGTRFVAEVALFYHPLTALSYSLDQALFGLDPAGFYATNLLVHLAAVAGLYGLARGLGASRWAASACGLVLGLHPIAAATVPSLPRRQDLVVGALLLGSMNCAARSGIWKAHLRWSAVAAAMTLFLLALGGKEIAYAGLAVVPFVVLASREGAHRSQAEPGVGPRHAVVIVLGFALLEAIAFGVRWRVLGGLGGYFGAAPVLGDSQGIFEYFVRPYLADVLWPFQSGLPERLRDWLILMGCVVLVLGLAIAGLPKQRQWMALVGVVWQAAFLGLYAVVHTSLGAYLLYVPLAGLALLVGAFLDGAADRVKHGLPGSRRAWLTFGCAGASAAGALVFVTGVVRTSALLTDYPEFRDAGAISSRFIDQAIACLESASAGSVVYVDGLPHRIDYPTRMSQFVDAFVFEPYSLESVVRLLAPDARASVMVRSSQDVHVRPAEIATTCSKAGDTWQLSVNPL